MSIAVYAGSFDPITNGHLDIIKKASIMFDKVVVGILINKKKKPVFSMRMKYLMITEALQEYGLNNVQVDIFDGLLIDFAKKHNTNIIIRGLRTTMDFESEFQMAQINEKLNSDIIVSFLKSTETNGCVSSSMVRELKEFNVDISEFVPQSVDKFYDIKDNKQVIALMGRSGSGKSTVSKLLEKDGYYIIDCDIIGHNILNLRTNSARKEVISVFRNFPEVYDESTDTINRKALGRVVFNSSEYLSKLNSIMFPEISRYTIREIYARDNTKFLIDAFGIDQTPIKYCCDKLIACIADTEECTRRIMKRDNITEKEALARLGNQPTNEYYTQITDGNIIDVGKVRDIKLEDIKEMFSL